MLDPRIAALGLTRVPNSADGDCALESALMATSADPCTLPEKSVVQQLRVRCTELVKDLLVRGNLETKEILRIQFCHASDPGINDEDLEAMTEKSASDWAVDHSKDGCYADSLMLMALCSVLDISIRLVTEVPEWRDGSLIIKGLDQSRLSSSTKVVIFAYFGLKFKVTWSGIFLFSTYI